MKFIDRKISESYYQLYIIFDHKEKKEYLDLVKKDLLNYKLEELQKQINLYKSISANTKSEQSKERYQSLKQEYNNMTIENCQFDTDLLELGLCDLLLKDILEHIEKLGIAQVFGQDTSVIGSFTDNNPLTLIYSFCYVNIDTTITYPKTKGNAYLFTSKDTDMIQTEMLIANNFYNKKESNITTEFSDVKFAYMCEDDIRFDLYMDISEIESKLQIDRSQLVGLNKNQYLIPNKEDKKCLINIKEIYEKDVMEITDEIAKKLNYLNTKTVKELRMKIKEVFSLVYNINSSVMSILENIAKVNEFKIDKYVKEHFLKLSGYEEITNDVLKEMKMNFITALIFANNDIDIDNYFFYLEQEYKLLYQVKKPEDEMTYEEYVNMKAPYYALYEIFRQKNLVTERS